MTGFAPVDLPDPFQVERFVSETAAYGVERPAGQDPGNAHALRDRSMDCVVGS